MAMRSERLDVFHNPDFTLPLRLPQDLPAVVTVHDVAYARFADSNSVRSRMLLNTFVPRSIRRADRVITVSHFTKSEVVDIYGTSPAKISVVPNGIGDQFSPPSLASVGDLRRRLGIPEDRVVLYVGGIEPRKNLVNLARSVAQIPGATLVIGGSRNRNAEAILSEVSLALGPRLVLPGYISDDDLPALYGSATVFAYPSLYEGFGIPPLEAMACGAPVACSNAASLPEAVGDAAEMFDPKDIDSITDALKGLLGEPHLRAERITQGRNQAAKFRWPEIAAATIRQYESVASAPRR